MVTNTVVLSDATRTIRRLAEIRLDDPVFITIYLSLDPSQFGTARERSAQIDSLVHELRTRELDESISHESRAAFTADVDRIEEWAKNDMDPQGVQGFAIFSGAAAGVFETIGVSAPVGPSVHVDRTARLEPLLSVIPVDAWCLMLVNRRTARIFRGNRDRLIEIESVTDDVHGQHEQGGWSQKRYERSVENEVLDHIQHGCDRLFEMFKEQPFDKLLIGCPQELRPDVEGKLHAYLQDRLVDHFEGEVEHINDAELSERVRPVIETHERRTESEIIERLAEQLGRNDRAVAGLRGVLLALDQKAVESLLLTQGLEAPGFVCAKCEWMDAKGGACPLDGTTLERVDNVIDSAVRSAILQSADVREVRYHEPDAALSAPVAALLRFDVADGN